MLHYSDIFKISNYKIRMDTLKKAEELKLKIKKIKQLLEDFADLHDSKTNKIIKLENEISVIKKEMSEYLNELENLVDQK